jgi:hypothetical protein
MLVVGVGLLAIVLLTTGTSDDPHGYAATFAFVGGALFAAPLLLYLWLIRRWWTGRGAAALAVADVGLTAVGAALLAVDYSPGQPWVAAVYAALAAAGAVLLWTEARSRSSAVTPVTPNPG